MTTNLQQPTAAEVAHMKEHIGDDLQPNLIAAFVVSLVLAYAAVTLRLIARWRVRATLEADDWFILVSLGMLTAFSVDSFLMVHYGLGRHIITVTNMAGLVQSIVAGEVLYSTSIVPIKISILFLYNRLFPSRAILRTSIGLGVFVLGYTIVQAICMMVQCIPLSSLWTHDGGKCIDINAVLTTMGILNVLTDLIIIVLPIPYLLKLHIQKTRKAQLIGMFALGGCVTIFGIVRAIMVGTSDPQDFSWSNSHGLLWSVLEISFGIVSACLPTLRPLFVMCPGQSSNGNFSRGSGSHSGNDRRTANKSIQSSSGHTSQQSNLHGVDIETKLNNNSDRDTPTPWDDHIDIGEEPEPRPSFARSAATFLGLSSNKPRSVDEFVELDGSPPPRHIWSRLGDRGAEKEESDANDQEEQRERARALARSASPNQIFVRTEISVQHDERRPKPPRKQKSIERGLGSQRDRQRQQSTSPALR